MKLLFENFRKYAELQDLVSESKKQAKQWMKQKKVAPDQIKAFFKYLDEEMVAYLGTGKDDVQKYIGWLVTKYGVIKDTGHIALDNDKMYADTDGAIWNLSSALNALHDYESYIRRNIIKGKDADFGRKTFKEIVDLNKPASEVVSRSQEKEMAKAGASIVLEDDDFFIVRPDTAEASCLFGRQTRWCISATKGQNYFDQYTSEGKVFYFLRNENLPEYHKLKKMAFVYDQDSIDTGDPYEIYDAEDTQIDMDEVRDGIKENIFGEKLFSIMEGDLKATMDDIRRYVDLGMKDFEDLTDENIGDFIEMDEELREQSDEITYEKWGDIRNEMLAHLEENQPGEILEEQMQKIQEAFEQKAKYFHVHHDDSGEGHWYFSGGTSFDFEDFEWSMDNAEDDIKKIIESVLDDNYIYPEYIEVEESGDGYRAMADISVDHDEPAGPEGFQSYTERLLGYDEKYEGMVEEMKEMFLQNGLLQSETFDYLSTLKDTLDEKIRNFSVDFVAGAVELSRSLQIDYALEVERLWNYKDQKGIWKREGNVAPAAEMSRALRYFLHGDRGLQNVFEIIFEDEIKKHIKPELQQMFLPGFEKEEEEQGDLKKQLDTILKNFLHVAAPRYIIHKNLFAIPITFRIPYSVSGEKLEQKYGVQFAKLLVKVAEILDAIYPAAFKKIKELVDKKFKEAEKRVDQSEADRRPQPVTENKKRIKIRILKS